MLGKAHTGNVGHYEKIYPKGNYRNIGGKWILSLWNTPKYQQDHRRILSQFRERHMLTKMRIMENTKEPWTKKENTPYHIIS